MFYDEARIYIKSGDGGDGAVSLHREKYRPHGGPDGGDGGRGGDVIVTVNPKLNTLVTFHRQVHFRAGDGERGGKNNRSGANGTDLILETPPGTLVRDDASGALLCDLTGAEQRFVLAQGGRGGRGNARFATPSNQTPRLAERGEPGVEKWVRLELKLIADVGIVGVPNAGKSTLLAVVSAAQPKIGDYPFTTLQPNLGVVTLDGYTTCVMADIPGLIEGAAAGTGLGHDFLRHIERTRILIHLLDGAARNPLEDWATVNRELALYAAGLENKPQLVVLNKLDLPDGVAWEPLVREAVEEAGYPFCAISAVTGQGVQQLLYQVSALLAAAPPVAPQAVEPVVIRPSAPPEQFQIAREGEHWQVSGAAIERITAMTFFEMADSAERFQRILEHMGISDALRQAGIADGDLVLIGDIELEWQEGA